MTYQEVYKGVPLINKMLDVYIANLAQKNPVTSKSLLLRDKEDINGDIHTDADYENTKHACEIFCDRIIDYFDILYKLKYQILPAQQLYGDSFVEVINMEDWDLKAALSGDKGSGGDYFIGESALSNNTKKVKKTSDEKYIGGLLEHVNTQINTNKKISSSLVEKMCDELGNLLCDDMNDNFKENMSIMESVANDNNKIDLTEGHAFKTVDDNKAFYEYVIGEGGKVIPRLKQYTKDSYKNLTESAKPKRGRKKKTLEESYDEFISANHTKNINLSKIAMIVHHPKNIIILDTKYGSKIGYIEVADTQDLPVTNIAQQLSTTLGRVVNLSDTHMYGKDEVLNKIVKVMIKKIIGDNKFKNDLDVDVITNNINPDVLNTIKRLVIETHKDNKSSYKKLKARFIPLERMYQFSIPSSEFAPYGKSFVEPLVLPGKLFILAQMSNVISKLSRAALVRKWIVDVGPTQQHARLIQQVKRDLYNSRVTIEDIMSFKSMPKLLSDSKDIFLVTKGGQRTLDMELQSFGDVSIKVADIEDARRELIALSGIPAAYLGYGDVVELQSQLVN